MDTLVSLVTPTYNHAKYIGRTITSLINQTYKNWELIVVDDGSTDNTESIVQSFNDSRIKYIYEERRGVARLAETMNVGFEKAKGELFTAIMSDDTWPEYRLERQVPIFENNDVVLCFGKQVIIDVNDKIIGYTPVPKFIKNKMNYPVGSILRYLLLGNFIPQPTVLIRHSALKKIGGYLQPHGLLAEDYPTHLELALIGEFRFLDLYLGNYRMHSHQQTRNIQLEMRKTDVEFQKRFYLNLDNKYKKLCQWSEQEFDHYLKNNLNHAYFGEGRRALLSGNKKEAIKHFRLAIKKGDLITKFKALLGFTSLYLNLNFEKLIRLFGRPPLG